MNQCALHQHSQTHHVLKNIMFADLIV